MTVYQVLVVLKDRAYPRVYIPMHLQLLRDAGAQLPRPASTIHEVEIPDIA